MVGYDSNSNKVYRMQPDDPRLLNEPNQKKIIWGYWISAVLIGSLAFVSFLFIKKKQL